MRGFLSLMFTCALLVAGTSHMHAQTTDSPVILTITGDIKDANRSRSDAFKDGFLTYHEKAFDRAFEVTRADLEALPQLEITADGEPKSWAKPVRLKGPLLADVLALAQVKGQTITLVALDGYAAELDVAAQSANTWILAHSMDGKPLAIGGRGPLWLARDTGDAKASEEELAKWVWSVFFIEVGLE